ncbi:MAG: hypothetical protein EXQ91_00760 [Alphaproteobacteria bacterium]|nr:hypothetical protein [Alphaproteobacteria bacterium]
MMHPMTHGARSLLVAGLLAAISGGVNAGSITVDNGAGSTSYLASLTSMVNSLRSLSQVYLDRAVGQYSGIELVYDPGTDRSMIYGTQGFRQTDADWARANLRIYDIYRQLGGNEIQLKQQYRSNGAQFYVGLDGSGGKWFGTLADAQGYMFKLLVGQSAEIPAAVKTALLATNTDDLSAVVARARDAMLEGRGILAAGTMTTVTLNGTGFSSVRGSPSVMAPTGIVVSNVALASVTQITATLEISESVATGLAKLLVFNAGNTFVPVDSFDILLVSGNGTLAPSADDHGGTAATATEVLIGSTTSGMIGAPGDNDVFKVTLATPGVLTLVSSGPTDVDVTLEDGAGTVIASDADSATWYNFSLGQALVAGTYFARVKHCCQGTGAYNITVTFSP